MAGGIHPAILTQGGLAPALKTLARRGTVPVELDAGSRAASPATLRVRGRRLSIFAPNEPGTSPRSALPAPRELQSAGVTPVARPGMATWPGELSVTSVTRRIEFHLLYPWQVT